MKRSIHYYALTAMLMSMAVVSTGQNSVLSAGSWYKISVTESGVHKITYEDLIDFGINPSDINPKTIRIYGNGNSMLPEPIGEFRYDDLQENAIVVSGEGDLSFDPDDYILFYGQEPAEIYFDPEIQCLKHEINLYVNKTCYFMTFNQQDGKRIDNQLEPPGNPTMEVTTSNEIWYHETESVNLIHSGKTWYGEEISSGSYWEFYVELKDIILSEPVYLNFSMAARSVNTGEVNVFAGSELISTFIPLPVNPGSTIYARKVTDSITFGAPAESFYFKIEYSTGDDTSSLWLDYFRINFIRDLTFNQHQLIFRNIENTGAGNISRFYVSDVDSVVTIWNVADPLNVKVVQGTFAGNEFIFKAETDSLVEFIAFDGIDFFSPEFEELVTNQDLHGAMPEDMLIVAHPDFVQHAEQLAALHENHDNLSSLVVTPELIYNEFSSGVKDVTAIRDFVKYLYEKSGGEKPGYLLLFGDASYDYRKHQTYSPGMVPVWESLESLNKVSSIASDDFYGLLDDEYTGFPSGTLDIAIGRLPARTINDAQVLVDKIFHYYDHQSFGPWRNNVVLCADDGDANLHLDATDELAGIFNENSPLINNSKLYFDLFKRYGSTIYSYPEVEEKILNSINEGVRLLYYTGHGSTEGWGSEDVFGKGDIPFVSNPDNMPVFITGTSEFGLFDDPAISSCGELLLLHDDGGGIAVISQTRPSFAGINFEVNKNLTEVLTSGQIRLGDALRSAKQPGSVSNANIALLGDPALTICYPDLDVKT
ncbi:MAG: type IX secretion system sortase PorU [Bacteroidales bacterium]|nr:type IX secretion system sortase PorU [Bacteroidales bacterium]